MNFTLHVWRQKGPNEPGRMVEYAARLAWALLPPDMQSEIHYL